MKRSMVRFFMLAALLAVATRAGAEDLTANAILVAQKSGASAEGLLSIVNDPSNTIAMTSGDLVTLRGAGVPESVLTALAARITPPTPAVAPAQPDDARLVELVRLNKSGISESIIAEQVRQSGRAFNLSVQDLLYLKQNGVPESTITLLQATQDAAPSALPKSATGTPAAPEELTFQDLVLVHRGYFKKSRPGRLVLRGEDLAWMDGEDPKENFEFKIHGLEKVWLTCRARAPENFCYQVNLDIVKGPTYHLRDVNQESGSNGAVLKLMDALRTYFPQLPYGPPEVD